MSSIIADSVEGFLVDPKLSDDSVQRTAFYLASSGDLLFAWLHTARNTESFDHGVVLCTSIGHEQLHSHRTLRHLANALAARGIPTLRFDWHGTGDSAGRDEDSGRCSTWRTNVRDAVRWMHVQIGCRKVSLVGLRMGAMLAAEALADDGCDQFVLWAPVTSGRSYVRQMQAIEKMTESRPRFADAAPGDIEAAGFLLSEESAAELSNSSLLRTPLNCRRALLIGPYDHGLAERFAALDVPVEQTSPPGFVEMMAAPHFTQVPHQAIREITTWLVQGIAADSVERLHLNLGHLGSCEISVASPAKSGRTVRERLLRFDADVDLFGIMAEPETPTNDLPTIVLLNAGAANRVGPGRVNVHLARHLAAEGFRCVRIDASGLGDSVSANVADENDSYPATVFRDIESTLEMLRARFGVRRCVLMGLCSGAYAAFQSAAQLANPALVESVLINPLTFYWRDGMTLDSVATQQFLKDHRCIARALNLKKLWKLITGRTEIGFLGATWLLARRLRHAASRSASNMTTQTDLAPIAVPSHPTKEDLPADLARVVAAGRTLTMFLAENDPGYAIMAYHARRQVKRLLRAGTLRIFAIKDADHTFSRRAPRMRFIQMVTEHLVRRHAQTSAWDSQQDNAQG